MGGVKATQANPAKAALLLAASPSGHLSKRARKESPTENSERKDVRAEDVGFEPAPTISKNADRVGCIVET